MPTAPNVKLLSVKAPATARTPRTLAEHLGDVLNVKSFGALGSGAHDDQSAIQACFDTAFGGPNDVNGASSPHGITNAHLNKAVFFPPGKYIISDPITLTDVYGARIFGSGRWTTLIENNDIVNSTGLITNGLSHCLISDMQINGANATGSIALDLNWDGTTGTAGLSHNLFENMEFGFVSSGVRIAHSSHEGHANQFLHCSVGTYSGAGGPGWLIEGADANINHIVGGNTNNTMDYAVKCTGGSFHVQALSTQTTAVADYYVSSGKPCSIIGCRTESPNVFIGIGTGTPTNGRAFISGLWHATPGNLANLTNFALTMDACVSGEGTAPSLAGGILVGDAASFFYSRGGVYLRDGAPSNDFYTGGPFSGTHTAGTYVI